MLLLRNAFAQRLPAMFFDYTAVGYLHACFYFVCVCLFPFSSFHFPLIFPPLALSIIGLSILFLRLLGVTDSPVGVGGGGKPFRRSCKLFSYHHDPELGHHLYHNPPHFTLHGFLRFHLLGSESGFGSDGAFSFLPGAMNSLHCGFSFPCPGVHALDSWLLRRVGWVAGVPSGSVSWSFCFGVFTESRKPGCGLSRSDLFLSCHSWKSHGMTPFALNSPTNAISITTASSSEPPRHSDLPDMMLVEPPKTNHKKITKPRKTRRSIGCWILA